MEAHHPRREAQSRLPEGLVARVLEPSPPAVATEPYRADDPTDPAGADGAVVSPVSGADHTWDDIVTADPELAGFAADRWLGARRRLEPLPAGFAETRADLHVLAYFVLAPARHSATGRLGLRFTRRGFGTPFFGEDRQLRVAEDRLIVQQRGSATEHQLTSPRAAAAAVGVPWRPDWFDGFHDPLAPPDPDRPLAVDADAARALGDWFGFATVVLEELRRTPGAVDPSRVQLWPEHFDPAVELGDSGIGRRASYGASPGDAALPEPYLYVSPWADAPSDDPYWNAPWFGGAFLPYSALLEADDQVSAGLDFLRRGHRGLGSG